MLPSPTILYRFLKAMLDEKSTLPGLLLFFNNAKFCFSFVFSEFVLCLFKFNLAFFETKFLSNGRFYDSLFPLFFTAEV